MSKEIPDFDWFEESQANTSPERTDPKNYVLHRFESGPNAHPPEKIMPNPLSEDALPTQLEE